MSMRPHFSIVVSLLLLVVAGCASIIGADFDHSAARDIGSEEAGGERGGEPDGTAVCPPQSETCKGKCGQLLDACQQLIECGGCMIGEMCGGGGTPNVC